ncbi:MAG: hypothetical protein AB8H86_33335 [Polyangiales bacterium]
MRFVLLSLTLLATICSCDDGATEPPDGSVADARSTDSATLLDAPLADAPLADVPLADVSLADAADASEPGCNAETCPEGVCAGDRCIDTQGRLLAFPTAMGAGAYSTGGRGGDVIHVTNLDDSGEGSLRWALTDESNRDNDRTIVFDVSGIIELSGDLVIGGLGGVTLAGQSAPQGNITITGGKVRFFGVDNVIVRYIKGRSTTNVEGILQSNDGNNIIFDHISASHVEAGEVAIGMTSNGELTLGKTIQHCLFYDSGLGTILADTTPPDDTHNETISILNNVFINVGHRVPGKIGGPSRIDVVNNFAHNWFARLIRIDDWSYTLNHVGNYYSKGGRSVQLAHAAYFNGRGTGRIFESDNYLDPDVGVFEWTDFDRPREDPVPASSFVDVAFAYNNLETLNIVPADSLKTSVLPFVGAYKYIDDNGNVVEERDAIDADAIEKGITEFQGDGSEEVTYTIALEEIPTANNSRPADFYQSNPHIPEAWLARQGIAGDASIHNQVQASGYTLLEEYLNQVDD